MTAYVLPLLLLILVVVRGEIRRTVLMQRAASGFVKVMLDAGY